MESERNLRLKFSPSVLERHFVQIETGRPLIAKVEQPLAGLRPYPEINEKHEYVDVGALLSGASYILALDRGLIAEINDAGIAIPAFTPGDFIQQLLPFHPDYQRLRE